MTKEQGLKTHCCVTHSPFISDISLQTFTFGGEKTPTNIKMPGNKQIIGKELNSTASGDLNER